MRRSLHLGVDVPDPAHYGDAVAPLAAAVADALAWHGWARAHGWDAGYPLTDAAATTAAVTSWVERAAAEAVTDVLITWSGHGTQLAGPADSAGDRTEGDGLDETWVLWDRLLLDDEIAALMARFPAGTRVTVVADSCHSSGSFRLDRLDGEPPRSRRLHPYRSATVIAEHAPLYDQVRASLSPPSPVRARFVGLAACAEDEVALESAGRGHFTAALLTLLGGAEPLSHAELVRRAADLTPGQHPRAFWYGYDASALEDPALR